MKEVLRNDIWSWWGSRQFSVKFWFWILSKGSKCFQNELLIKERTWRSYYSKTFVDWWEHSMIDFSNWKLYILDSRWSYHQKLLRMNSRFLQEWTLLLQLRVGIFWFAMIKDEKKINLELISIIFQKISPNFELWVMFMRENPWNIDVQKNDRIWNVQVFKAVWSFVKNQRNNWHILEESAFKIILISIWFIKSENSDFICFVSFSIVRKRERLK
jgi:hypothetical protein